MYLEICFLKLSDPTSRSWKIFRGEFLADNRTEGVEHIWLSKGLIAYTEVLEKEFGSLKFGTLKGTR
jgi:hypothetical protein